MRPFAFVLLLAPLCAACAQSRPLTGYLAAGQQASHPLTLAPGDFVHGRFEGRGLRLTLADAQGRPLRVLAQGERDAEEFMLVAADPPPARLVVAAPDRPAPDRPAQDHQTPYRLTVKPAVPRADAAGRDPGGDLGSDGAADLGAVASPVLRAVSAQGDSRLFWRQTQAHGTPLVEEWAPGQVLLTFVWRGEHDNVWLFSAPSGRHDPMRRLGTTDIWFASYVVPDSTRMTYKIAPDVPDLDLPPHEKRRLILATAQRDPLNPRTFPDRPTDIWAGESLVELPQAPPQPWVGRRPGVAAGTVETVRLNSDILGNGRDMVLYRPPGWVEGRRDNALLVLFDAELFHAKADVTAILDNLHHSGAIPATAALMIANPSNETRSRELPPNPDFARFLDREALPWAAARGLAAEPARTVVAGASFGGLAASYLGLTLPHRFGNVIGQSSSFWWAPAGEADGWLLRHAASLPRQPVRFFLEAGLFEGNSRSILQTNRAMRDLLAGKGYFIDYHEHAGGHDLARWRSTLADGLLALMGGYSAPSQETSAVNR